MKDICQERARLLVRMVYRLALAEIDVNARDDRGDTPLNKAAANLDQNLMTHILRIGTSQRHIQDLWKGNFENCVSPERGHVQNSRTLRDIKSKENDTKRAQTGSEPLGATL